MTKRLTFIASAAAAALCASTALAADPPKKTPALVAKGKASFELNCASCHGSTGAGDGIAAATLQPKPRNLVTAPFQKGTRPAEVFATIEKGIPGTGMISFAHLPEEERWGLTYYVLELRGAKKASKK